ncbi:MAG: hypothetical protein CMF38_05155 [Legionellaceae bacterium]|nr:hypothetical protein [Legionellaceae bacterium]HAF87342.1 hypothetical protein [Legionellales bacterium]HCA88730.1 hypothetical protein [Legionellales bacterium]|tara:strand:+ start:947 stop:2392 length:1446 start_codon:yes stop_codon:yes gene_type:complete
MKKLIGLVVVLALLILGGYYFMGVLTEKKIKNNLAVVNQVDNMFVQLASYKRGWFTSKVVLDWRMRIPEHTMGDAKNQTIPAEDLELRMPITIYHGPVIFAHQKVKFGLGYGKTSIALPPKYQQRFNEQFTANSIKPQLNLSLLITYMADSRWNLEVPPFTLIGKSGQQLDWLGLNSVMQTHDNQQKIKGHAKLKGITFERNQLHVNLAPVESEYNLHKTMQGLYLGEASISLPALTMRDATQTLLAIRQVYLHSDSDIVDEKFSLHLDGKVAQIEHNNKVYGPGAYDIRIKNLNASALGRINQKLNQVEPGQAAQKKQVLLQVLPEIPALLNQGPAFEINQLSFTTPQGNLTGQLSLSLPPNKDNNPFTMLQSLEGKADLRVPGEWIKLMLNRANRQKVIAKRLQNQTTSTDLSHNGVATHVNALDVAQEAEVLTNNQIASLVQAHVLIQDGQYYVTKLILNQGKLEVNGKPFESSMIKL